ncbi:MAG: hypothetical protein J5845_02415 [Lachnospiraceae bacterium]|nr:hypothetical protein [Lachnospiraceae bacterium]
MKTAINKKVFRDVFHRTRIIRITAVILATLMSVIFYGYAAESYEWYVPRIFFLRYSLILTAVVMILQELRIHKFHRNRKCEVFYSLPFSKRQWFVSTTLVSLVNLVIMIAVLLTEEGILIWLHDRKSTVNPVPVEVFRQALFLFAVGAVMISVIAFVREMSHNALSFFALLIGITVSFWMGTGLYGYMKEAYANGFGYNPNGWLYRIRLLYRAFSGEPGWLRDNLQVCYDIPALLLNLLFASGILFLAARIADRSYAEYVGAEHRNKSLFITFVLLTNLVPMLIAMTQIVTGDGSDGYIAILLIVLLAVLTVILFCRLFQEKPGRRLLYGLGIAALSVLALCAAAKVFTMIDGIVPAQDHIVAVQQDGYLFTDADAIAEAYEDISEAKGLRNEREKRNGAYYTVFTKTGVREYCVAGDGLIEFPADGTPIPRYPYGNILLEYGKKPVKLSTFKKTKDLEEFLSLIPEDYTEKNTVYYYNGLGGISKSSEYICSTDRRKTGFVPGRLSFSCYGVNYIAGYEAVNYPSGSDAMKMMIEKNLLPEWRENCEDLLEESRQVNISFYAAEKDGTVWSGRFITMCEKGRFLKNEEYPELAEFLDDLLLHPENYVAGDDGVVTLIMWWNTEKGTYNSSLYLSPLKAKALKVKAEKDDFPAQKEETE